MIRKLQAKDEVTLSFSKDEALVLLEMLQRLTDDNEKYLLPLLHSSAEFAVLCAINSDLEQIMAEPFLDNYDELVKKARSAIIKRWGTFEGIEEK